MTWLNMLGLLLTGPWRKYVVHNREFASLARPLVPADRDHIPNWVRQPSIPAWVYWTGWSFTSTDIGDHILDITSMIREYPREDLLTTR